MSFQATEWARGLPLHSLSAKFTLLMIASYAGTDDACFPSLSRLAEDTLQSIATVRRRIRELEQLGVLVRMARWASPDGRVVVTHIGDDKRPAECRQTSDELRLQLKSTADDITARIRDLGWDKRHRGDDEDEAEEGEGRVSNCNPSTALQPPPYQMADTPGVPPGSHPLNRNSENSEEKNPPDPPSGGDAHQANDCEGWQEFKTAFEADGEPIVRVSIALQLFAALSIEERNRVTKAARGLICHRLKQRKPSAKPSAQTFIREIDAWPSWLAHAPTEAKPPPAKTMIFQGSRAFVGLMVIKRIWNRDPPEGAAEVLADAVAPLESLSGLLDRDEWVGIFEQRHARQAQAWRERLGKCGFQMPPPQRVATGEVHPVLGPVHHLGWVLPTEWPPRMDGTLPETEKMETRERC